MGRQLFTTCLLVVTAVGMFRLSSDIPQLAFPAIIIHVYCLLALSWQSSRRMAFYPTLLTAFTIAVIELSFFWDVFGPGAIGLWLVLGLWGGLFGISAHWIHEKYQVHHSWMTPILWMGFEYFRSELYYLKFSWLTPSLTLTSTPWQPLLVIGQYGTSAALVALAIWAKQMPKSGWAVITTISIVVFLVPDKRTQNASGPTVVGIQLEFPAEPVVLEFLDRSLFDHPDADLFVLSEYTFDGPVPESVRNWCRHSEKYLIAGGKESAKGDDFYNTVFVVGADGNIVHKQVKAVPIQFMSDGLPTEDQNVWASPWGNIGIAICYDLSYSTVIDELIRQDAVAIINPTMDPVHWGEYEHRLHSRIPVCRSTEYHIPIVRVASSGISLITDEHGNVVSSAGYGKSGGTIKATLNTIHDPQLPLDRWLGLASVLTTLLLLLWGRFLPQASSVAMV